MTTATERRVSGPYENTRKRISRDGLYPWSVTLKQGCRVETQTFYDRAEADALVGKALAAGFRRIA